MKKVHFYIGISKAFMLKAGRHKKHLLEHIKDIGMLDERLTGFRQN